MTWRGSSTVSDRIFASLAYLIPFLDAFGFALPLLQQFPQLAIVFAPFMPLIGIYYGVPYLPILIFFGLFILVIRNINISHLIRFNTMQAILLSIAIFLCRILAGVIGYVGGNFATQTLSTTIFLGVLISVVYSVAQTLMGRYAEIPAISDAVYMQVPR